MRNPSCLSRDFLGLRNFFFIWGFLFFSSAFSFHPSLGIYFRIGHFGHRTFSESDITSGIMGSKATSGSSRSATDSGLGRQWIMGTEAFEARMPHHDGIKALWETKWKFPVSLIT